MLSESNSGSTMKGGVHMGPSPVTFPGISLHMESEQTDPMLIISPQISQCSTDTEFREQ